MKSMRLTRVATLWQTAFTLLFFLNLVLQTTLALAQNARTIPVTLPRLEIVTNSDFGEETVLYQKYCKDLAFLLSRGRGESATGAFASASCISSANLEVPSAELKKPTKPKKKSTKAKPAQWRLVISQLESKATFEIFFSKDADFTTDSSSPSEKPAPFLVSSFTLEDTDSILELLSNKKIRRLIARYLSTDLPMQGIVSTKDLRQKSAIPLKRPSPSNDEASTLLLYTLDFDTVEKSWIPTIQGTAVLEEITQDNATRTIRRQWTVTLDQPATVSSRQTAKRKRRPTFYFYREVRDRAPQLQALVEEIDSTKDSLATKFLKLGRSAYTGVRYAMPVSKGTSPINKSPLIGVFGEFRSGILNGLRINYDVIPSKTTVSSLVSSEDEDLVITTTQSYEWSRFQLGYAFGASLDLPVINWVDITPRLGVTSLRYKEQGLLSEEDPDFQDIGNDFTQSRAPTVGLELGIETRGNSYLVRYWAFGNYSSGVLAIDKKSSTRTVRVGLDLYRDVVDIGPLKFTLLGFGCYDSTIISKSSGLITTEENSEESEVTTSTQPIKDLMLQVWYLGAGLTIRW
jgi:hypothetical protein